MTAAWQTVLAIDFDKWAARTYAANFPGVDVRCASVADIIPAVGPLDRAVTALPSCDVLLGGPPCQPHSFAGKRGASDDERDGGPDFVSAIGRMRPRMFLMENVEGLMSSEDGRYAAMLMRLMENAGYTVQIRVLNSVAFGVPQFRVRCFWWGIRRDVFAGGVRHRWPVPTHAWPPPEPSMFGHTLLSGVTVRQALGLDGMLHRKRGAGMLERAGGRPDHPTGEPSPAITNAFAEGGSGGLFIQSHADPAQTVDRPAPALRSGGAGHEGCRLQLEMEAVMDGQNETIHGSPTVEINDAEKYRWSDAMLTKHPPAQPAQPAPTVQAKYYKGGAEGLVDVSEFVIGDAQLRQMAEYERKSGCVNSRELRADEPARTVTARNAQGTTSDALRIAWKQKGDLWIRRLTPWECARLQSVPDDFVWPSDITKTQVYRVVGNGWACRMGLVFGEAFRAADPESRTVVDLFCGGGLGAVGWHGRAWNRGGSNG